MAPIRNLSPLQKPTKPSLTARLGAYTTSMDMKVLPSISRVAGSGHMIHSTYFLDFSAVAVISAAEGRGAVQIWKSA